MYTPEQQVAALSWMPTASKQEEELRVGCVSDIMARGLASMPETQPTHHSTSLRAAMPETPATRVRGGG